MGPRRLFQPSSLRAMLLWAVVLFCGHPAAAASMPCDPDDEGKDGLCGRALAAAAAFARDGYAADPVVLAAEGEDDTDVTHCLLDIEINTSARTVSGANTLDVTSRVAGLTQFTLDLRDNMSVDGVSVNGVATGYARSGHKLTVDLGRAFEPGQSFTVRVAYHGTPQNLGWGSFDFGRHAGTPVVASLSQPYWAHTWWPCKEAIHDKFTMQMWVTVPDTMTVASNGLLEGTDTLSGSRKRFRWREDCPISVYLVSLAATNYTKWTEWYVHPAGRMPVEFYIYPEEVSAVRPLLADVVTMISTFSRPDLFGEYPFVNEKYGIAQFEWCCGMEHQTITSQGSFPERRTVHELAHAWWGDYVTCKTWHDIWLNEGFARWAEALWYERRPGGGYPAYINYLQAYRPSSYEGTVYRYDISTPDAIFSTTYAYNKAGWVVHMLRHVLGDGLFFETLAAYRAAFGGGAASTSDFQSVAESVAHMDLGWFFNEWVYNGGAPYYEFGWEPAYLADRHWVRLHIDQVPSYPVFRMPIDISMTTQTGTDTRVVWNSEPRQWYLLPADGPVTTVQFDKDTWILRGSATEEPYVPGPPRLIRVDPPPGSTLLTPLASVLLWFSDPVSFTDADFEATGSATGATSLTAAYAAGPDRVRLTFPIPLQKGQTWTIRVRDSLRSQSGGLVFDGEMGQASPVLPTGDGLPGGIAGFRYTIVIRGDVDQDGDVDVSDFAFFQACFNGPAQPVPRPECLNVDFDRDGDVDVTDFTVFQLCFNGAGQPPASGC